MGSSGITSVEGNISFSHRNLGPVNQLEDSSSLTVRPGGVVCRIFISRDISPLLRVCAEINFLHPVSYERVKTSCFIVDVPQNYLGVRPEEFFNIRISKFFLEHVADLD